MRAIPPQMSAVLAVLVGVAVFAPLAAADTVNLNTYAGSGWQVERAPTLGGEFAAPVNVAYVWNGLWAPPATYGYTSLIPNATWVGDGAGGAGDVNGTTYLYSRTFVLATTFSGPGTFSLQGNLGADNWVVLDGVQLSYTNADGSGSIPVTTDGYHAGEEYGFINQFMIHAEVPSNLFVSPTTFTLTAKVVNSYAAMSNGQWPGPAAFIFAGDATAEPQSGGPLPAVPVPAALPVGLAMLGLLGGAKAARRHDQVD